MPPSLSYKINSSFPDLEKSESLSLCSIIVMSSFPITLEPQCMRGPSQSCSEVASTILKGTQTHASQTLEMAFSPPSICPWHVV